MADPRLPEGEEQAPAGTRAAAAVRWALVVLMGLAAVGAWASYAAGAGGASAQVRYHCPMHPTVVQQHKGECPICGMDLVPIAGADAPAAAKPTRAKPAAESGSMPASMPSSMLGSKPASAPARGPAQATEYTCPMHPSFVTTDAAARCPTCGMKLEPKVAAAARYTCPMHPAFVTADPAARCPTCGMKLVPASADAAPPEGVPGLSPVELSASRIQLMGLRTAAASRDPLPTSLRAAAFVAPTENGVVSVTARYTGWVESVAVGETGRAVGKGDVLATVYSPDLVAALQGVVATARWAPRQAQGAKPSQNDPVREARQRVELLGVAPRDVEAIDPAAEIPQVLPIRSPVRGFVARRSVLRGTYLTPGTELFQIADLSKVWAIVEVDEAEVGRVKVGQRATLELPAWPGERFTGRVTFVSPALASGSRSVEARVELGNPDLRLRPGMYGDVTLDLGAVDAVTVPSDAVVDTGELQYVFVSRGAGRFEPRRVRTGWRGAGRVALLSGVQDGERVVTGASFLLDSESRLRSAVGEPDADDAPPAPAAGDGHAHPAASR